MKLIGAGWLVPDYLAAQLAEHVVIVRVNMNIQAVGRCKRWLEIEGAAGIAEEDRRIDEIVREKRCEVVGQGLTDRHRRRSRWGRVVPQRCPETGEKERA